MKPYKVKGKDGKDVELTLKPNSLGNINKAIKLFNDLDNAKSQFYNEINWDLIGKYEERALQLQTAFQQVKNLIQEFDGKEKLDAKDKKDLAENKKYLKKIETSLLELERDIVKDRLAVREYTKKSQKETAGRILFYTEDDNMKKIFESTVDGDLDKIDFNNADNFFGLMRVARRIEADFFTVFGKMIRT